MSDEALEGNPATALSDNILLERLNRGDVASFEVLFYRHYDRVYGLLFRLLGNRVEAEDVTQEVFLKLYRKPLRGKQKHNVSAWLYRVATNMGYNHLRGRKRRWQRNLVLVPDQSDNSADPSERAIRQETKAAVREALARLPKRQTQLLLLRQMGLSYAELAEACDIAPASVGKLLSRAADAFRNSYGLEVEDIV
ncbi:MAG: sigma-70 family RNA polymerase sigma factor [Chloroflexota bacterium]|jgi:RNA polymerase sigma-70 factor (ECF subfamily)